jgi:hypothetical protein
MLEVKLNDQLWVQGLGYATVSRLQDNGGFYLKIGQSEKLFTADGRIGHTGEQKVFYADPMIVVPPKSVDFWAAYKRVAKALYDEMAMLYNMEQGG